MDKFLSIAEKVFISNPQLLIAVMCLIGLYLIITKFGRAFIASQESIATAIASMSTTINNHNDVINRLVIESGRSQSAIMAMGAKIDALQCVKQKPQMCFMEHVE